MTTISMLSSTVLAIGLLGAGAGPGLAAEIHGFWESVDRSQGGIGMTWELRSDGTICLSPGAMVDSRYRVEGNRIVGDDETVMTYDPKTDRLTSSLPEAEQALELERAAGAETGSVLGVWRYSDTEPAAESPGVDPETARVMLRNSRFVFLEDGRELFRLPFRTDCGRYSMDDETLSATIGGQELKWRVEVEGALLTLVSSKGEPTMLRRREW